jgi:photosystem II stability/assembly factor-like uncharacterized protein
MDPSHGWAIGTAGTFFFEGDGWKRTRSRAYANGKELVNSLDVAIGLPSWEPCYIWFLNPELGWLSNSNGFLAHTSDGGRTWRDIFRVGKLDSFGRAVFFQGIHFFDSQLGLALDSTARVWLTNNGGNDWSQDDLGLVVLGFYFSDRQDEGWLVAYGGLYRVRVSKQ